MNKIIRNIKGITLISLVITIIILLILTGVTLNLTVGENGIFKIAEQAAKNYSNEQDKEIADIENLYSSMKIATNDNSQITVSIDDLKNIIKEEVKRSSATTIYTGTVITNSLGATDTSTKVNSYTVQESGKYVITYNSLLQMIDESNVAIFCRKNGSDLVKHSYSSNAEWSEDWGGMELTTIEQLNAGDIIDVFVYQYNNGSAGQYDLTMNKLQLIKIGN